MDAHHTLQNVTPEMAGKANLSAKSMRWRCECGCMKFAVIERPQQPLPMLLCLACNKTLAQ